MHGDWFIGPVFPFMLVSACARLFFQPNKLKERGRVNTQLLYFGGEQTPVVLLYFI